MESARKASVLLVLALVCTPAAAFAQRKGPRNPAPPAGSSAPSQATGSTNGTSGTSGTPTRNSVSASPSASASAGSASPSASAGPDSASAAKAQQHFKRARELYGQGSYTEAIGELEAAHTLDPTAKDLVYNLILVNEKLGRIDAALSHMQTYMKMDLDANERTRAENTTRRLEGAKRELEAHKPKPPPPVKEIVVQRVTTKVEYGRVDALTVSAAVIGVAGLGVGTFFGLKALGDRPTDFTTGRDGTYDDLTRRAEDSHKQAQIADIGFAIGAVGTVATLILYFARTKHPKGSSEVTVHGGSAFWRVSF